MYVCMYVCMHLFSIMDVYYFQLLYGPTHKYYQCTSLCIHMNHRIYILYTI